MGRTEESIQDKMEMVDAKALGRSRLGEFSNKKVASVTEILFACGEGEKRGREEDSGESDRSWFSHI